MKKIVLLAVIAVMTACSSDDNSDNNNNCDDKIFLLERNCTTGSGCTNRVSYGPSADELTTIFLNDASYYYYEEDFVAGETCWEGVRN